MNTNFKPTVAVLYHANCVDGIMSAVITGIGLALGTKKHSDTIQSIVSAAKNNIEFIHVNYGQEFPEISETVTNVIIVDFSFDIAKIEAFLTSRQQHVNIVEYDHHETAALHLCECATKEKLFRTGMDIPKRDVFTPNNWNNKQGLFTAIINQEMSGALLSFDAAMLLFYSYITEEKYEFIKYIAQRVSDRDLWNFNYSDTRTVYECLISMIDYGNKETVFTLMKLLLGTTIDQFHRMPEYIKAETRVEMRLQFAKEYAAKAVKVYIDNKVGALVNTPANFSSEVGDVLGQTHDFAIMYVVGREKHSKEANVWFSLRSNKATGINVEQLAKKLSDNGGGHVNAAGFRGTLSTLKSLYRHSYVNEEDKPETLLVSGYDFPVTMEKLHRITDEEFDIAFMKTQPFTELNMSDKSFFLDMSPAYDWSKLIPIIKTLEGVAIEIADTALKLRHDAAVSGAMRWEWSHEAAVHTESSFTMRVV
jgi:nanoRNase/pAp phosphatase (c-di-AMP/oligoRNAs hydrolase)